MFSEGSQRGLTGLGESSFGERKLRNFSSKKAEPLRPLRPLRPLVSIAESWM